MVVAIKESPAYILQTYSLHEADRMCVFFTRHYGKIRGVARGARRVRSRFGASLEPLSEVSVVFSEQEGREIAKILDCELLHSAFEIGTMVEGEAVLHYFVELVDRMNPANEPNEKVYRLLSAVMGCMRENVRLWPALITYFEVWLLKLSGYFPCLDQCVHCKRYLPTGVPIYLVDRGTPLCTSCGSAHGGSLIPSLVREGVHRLLSEPPLKWVGTEINWELWRPLKTFLRAQLKHVVESEIIAEPFVHYFQEVVKQ